MESTVRPLLLGRLNPIQVQERIARDPRLILPLGACDQYGGHLPIGAAGLVAERIAHDLSAEFEVLCAPVLSYGVNVPAERPYPGTASLREKTLHASLNDLLASWEDDGFEEFVIITVHGYDAHVEAAATVTTASARVRVIEIVNLDVSETFGSSASPDHGGEILTSLMAHLFPELVRMELAVDFVPGERSASTLRRFPKLPAASPGSIGRPTLATPEKGRRLYEHILEKIRTRIFAVGPEAA